VLLGAMTLDMFAVMFGGARALLPVYAVSVLQADVIGYGILSASLEAGTVVMALILIVLPPVRRMGMVLLFAVATFGLATILFGVSRWLPLSVLAYLLAHDAWFYWTHRWMHRPAVFRRIHAVHHASRPPTAWAAMSFHPVEALTGAVVIPPLVFVVPIHVAGLGAVLAIMTVMGVTNHMGWELFPRALARSGWLITASHHQRHHQLYRCNYGLYFRLWDRLCGTDRGLGTV
jgi:sterol desaturase/sphingolipid hydroxylase (fatty acid hydroxylase superfamily)